jgi:hypothetical protein
MEKKRKEKLNMRSSNRSLRVFFTAVSGVLLLTLAIISAPAAGNVEGDLRGGYNTDVENGLIGGGVNADLGSSWDFNPNAEWVFVDGYDLWSVNADFHYDFNVDGPALWLGAGPALIVTDFDPSGPSDEDLGMNLLGGIGAKQGEVRPFGQVKVTLADNSSSAMAVGVRF